MPGSSTSSSSAASPSDSCVSEPVTDANGMSYTIQCHSTVELLGAVSFCTRAGDYTQCMTACDSTLGCSGWTWSPYQLHLLLQTRDSLIHY
jgi:hypothetical protein